MLIKKKCHEYDEEWRIITKRIMQPPIMMEWIPSGIILGLRMGTAEENLVVSMAKEAGIKKIYNVFKLKIIDPISNFFKKVFGKIKSLWNKVKKQAI